MSCRWCELYRFGFSNGPLPQGEGEFLSSFLALASRELYSAPGCGVIQSGYGAPSIALRKPFNTQSNALRSAMEAAFLTHFESHPAGLSATAQLRRTTENAASVG